MPEGPKGMCLPRATTECWVFHLYRSGSSARINLLFRVFFGSARYRRLRSVLVCLVWATKARRIKEISARERQKLTDSSSPRAPPFERPWPFAEVAGELEQKFSPTTDCAGTSTSVYDGSMIPAQPIPVPTYIPHENVSWVQLPADLQFYLDYHRNHLDHHVYFFRHRCDHFLHTILPNLALTYEPLLFSVVGFAAFQMALKEASGKIEIFLGYYNRSVAGLRKSLADGQAHSETMILTILQLATFEVWVQQSSRCSRLTQCRNTWGTGGTCWVIKRPPIGCSLNYTQSTRSWAMKCRELYYRGIPASTFPQG